MLNNVNKMIDLTSNAEPETIGIFDSGMGGLTIVNAIRETMPYQKLLYVGDTAHCPWGDKSISQITFYAQQITNFLIENRCKIIIIACNTASCITFNALQDQFDNIKLFNIIDPTVKYLQQIICDCNDIGIIGTKQTIRSQAYQTRIAKLQQVIPAQLGSRVKALATPLLVPLIEEGFLEHAASNLIIENYLVNLNLVNNSVLILGCTHYPLIKKTIENYYKNLHKNIIIIDSATLIAQEIKNYLTSNNLLQTHKQIGSSNHDSSEFYCTEDGGFFIDIAQRFFPDLKFKFLPLWE